MKITVAKRRNIPGPESVYDISIDGRTTGFTAYRPNGRARWSIDPPAPLARDYQGRDKATFLRLHEVRAALDCMVNRHGEKLGLKAAVTGKEPAEMTQ